MLLMIPAVDAMAQGVAATDKETQFSISSPDFVNEQSVPLKQIYNGGGCHGENRSPAISWRHAPPGTKSFAITLLDRDAPGRGWWHWAVANIPADIHQLPENASRSGALAAIGAVQARNDFDNEGYSGPCPPAGQVRHFVLTVYALNIATLRVDADRPAPFYDHEISDSSLGSAHIVVTNAAKQMGTNTPGNNQ